MRGIITWRCFKSRYYQHTFNTLKQQFNHPMNEIHASFLAMKFYQKNLAVAISPLSGHTELLRPYIRIFFNEIDQLLKNICHTISSVSMQHMQVVVL